MGKHLRRLAVGGIVIGVLVGFGLAVYYGHFYIKHFRVVQEGVLYRSGQPDKGDLKRLRDAYGVRTIVNLRRVGEQNGSKGLSLDQERSEAQRLGLRFIHLPIDGDAEVDPNIVNRWLQIAQDPENRPVLVHCKAGVDRAGLLAAVYRIRAQGWSPQKALDEAIEEGMDPRDDANLKEYILTCRSSQRRQ